MTLFPTHSLRFVLRDEFRILQQLFTDEKGRNHWIDVPLVKETP